MGYLKNYDEFEQLLSEQLLILMVGNIGTGKTTIAEYIRTLLPSAFYISGDDLEKQIDSSKIFGHIYIKISDKIKEKITVIIDGRNLQEDKRLKTITPALKLEVPVLIVDCGKGTKKDLNRRLQKDRGVSKEMWQVQFQENSDEYQKPEISEENIFIISRETIKQFQNFKEYILLEQENGN